MIPFPGATWSLWAHANPMGKDRGRMRRDETNDMDVVTWYMKKQFRLCKDSKQSLGKEEAHVTSGRYWLFGKNTQVDGQTYGFHQIFGPVL